MSAFLGISVWITLAMVVPGLVTMALLYGAITITNNGLTLFSLAHIREQSEWIVAGFALTSMIMTQALGILLERILVKYKLLGPETYTLSIAPGIDPLGDQKINLKPYDEFNGAYLLLAELRADEDAHGHLQRTLAQFFLTNNTIVSFIIAALMASYCMMIASVKKELNSILYFEFLIVCIVANYIVVKIRFEVMTKALWAARRRRLEDAVGKQSIRNNSTNTPLGFKHEAQHGGIRG